jgi:hypothetical protein
MDIQKFLDHVTREYGVSDDAKYPFKTGYLIGLISDIMLEFPETRKVLEFHARKIDYKENV